MANFTPPYAGIYHIPTLTPSFIHSIPDPRWLPQVSLSSVTKLQQIASRTSLSQTFINPSDVSPITEAKYTFPLYESCAIVSFRCYVGTRLIKGIIKEKKEANTEYHEAVQKHEPASLLEQHTPDVFSTSLGNIPPGEVVRVEIEYIMELKHDAEVDALRLTIPTNIAPRYGHLPCHLHIPGTAVEGINISVEVTMSSNIQSVESPSHPISIHLGGHTKDLDDNFNPRHALATLSRRFTELDKDFILLIKCATLSSPTALLEKHPTIPDSKALMLTLVPKFNLPEGPKPEVVFIADRSGSMSSRMTPLKLSLRVFLKSLPLDIKFNICSFGSRHSFLWEKSQPYSDTSFQEAQRYCDTMEANFGGTEILPAVEATISKRFKGLNLEIMVLTDGQVWNSDELFDYVERKTAKRDVRVFSLGIGHDVSHALIDGLARVGGGFSQIVSHEGEGMESKVARMLSGALSAHVLDYRVEWEGEDALKNPKFSLTSAVKAISRFDPNANTDSPVPFSKPPDLVVPSILQAPHKLQPLFPFSRTTVYAILSEDAQPPERVWLRGTTPSGDKLELEVAVHPVPERGQTIHQLAARKVLQELKEGTGYIHSGKYGISKESHSGSFDECVKREGVRVGLKYGLASHWTSFVALIQTEEDMEVEKVSLDAEVSTELDDAEEYVFICNDGEVSTSSTGGLAAGPSAAPPRPSQHAASVPVMMAFPPAPPAIPYPQKYSLSSKLSPHSLKDKPGKGKGAHTKSSPPSYSDLSYSPPSVWSPPTVHHTRDFSSLYSKPSASQVPPSPTSPFPLTSTDPLDLLSSPPNSVPGKGYAKGSDTKSKGSLSADSTFSKHHHKKWLSKGTEPDISDIAIMYSPANAPPAARLSSDTATQPMSQRTKSLIDLQTFEGSFLLNSTLAALLGISITALEARLENFVPSNPSLSQENKKSLWATVLVVELFETQLAGERSVWQLVVDKARAWTRMGGSAKVALVDIQALEKMTREVLGT